MAFAALAVASAAVDAFAVHDMHPRDVGTIVAFVVLAIAGAELVLAFGFGALALAFGSPHGPRRALTVALVLGAILAVPVVGLGLVLAFAILTR